MRRLADPVLRNLAAGTLKARMPVEQAARADRRAVTHLEALGRLVAGLAPWIEIAPDTTAEGRLRAEYADLARRAIARAVDPASPDFMNFTRERQPLVDAAFLAQGLLRARRALRDDLDATTRAQLVSALQSTRVIVPPFNNWLLFAATVEAGLAALGAPWDRMRVDYALRQHEQWYKGDGHYGDGPSFHWDYYNSFVIQPMLIDVLDACGEEMPAWKEMDGRVRERAARYAAIQERLISPEGTFPRDRPVARLPFRRLPSAGADRAAARVAGGDFPGAGAWRPHQRHPAVRRRPRHVRRRRMAAHRVLRPSAGGRGNLHLDRQPLSLLGRSPAARPARLGRVLVRGGGALDVGSRMGRAVVSHRSRPANLSSPDPL